MTAVLVLLLVNAALGAWDTLWYHEYRARLTARLDDTAAELRLHAARDGIYVGLYGFLAVFEPRGLVVGVVFAALAAEIAITLADFVIEDRDRPAIGGLAPGERVLHSVMAIVYGAMLARLVPVLMAGIHEPTGATLHDAPVALSVGALLAAMGIAISGTRDFLALGGFDPIWTVGDRSRARSGERTRPTSLKSLRLGAEPRTWSSSPSTVEQAGSSTSVSRSSPGSSTSSTSWCSSTTTPPAPLASSR